ncbi:hypothetical protein L5515_004355 [Caenorhabditis briggsae]|uniref:Uncharacterized protein n=1 Tax=Caenorhabditis briggsae TaxID=6238 RepID=A0AAE9JDE4_CAEBR|nr:hypothetical protein L3Y34_001501 [Caenorhabditis briggsae]UMM23836.1 hypothetical protein L5515_004355 [Caenorhabditis briggsae]
MSKAIYEYHKINELIPGPSRWNFYGKIIFMCNIADQLLLLLKDETSSMYVYMNSKDNKEPIVGLKLRQVIRIHRGNVRRNPTTNTKEGVVQVEMAGCHFVAWPHFGDANNPISKSSKNWTKSDIDQEKINELSELGNDQPITKAEELAIQLVSHREKTRNDDTVRNWWKMSKIESEQSSARKARELSLISIGDPVEMDNEYDIDDSSFLESCLKKYKTVWYISDESKEECFKCKQKVQCKVAVRVKLKFETHNIYFTFPIELVKNKECYSYIEKLIASDGTPEHVDEIHKFQETVKEALQNFCLTKIKGMVVAKSNKLKFVDIYLFNCKLLRLTR